MRQWLGLALALLAVASCGGSADGHRSENAPCLAVSEIGTIIPIAGGSLNRQTAFEAEERVGGTGRVEAFSIDATEVTNQQFAAFVAATGYVTVAEQRGANGIRFGAALFDRKSGTWRIDPQANWRQPGGDGTSIETAPTRPVVAVAYDDALAYAQWRGRRLPTEGEWEWAARRETLAPPVIDAEARDNEGTAIANTWQGAFPVHDTGADGYAGVAPVGCFAPNAAGAYDMIGNIWEWTSDWYAAASLPENETAARRADPEGLGNRVIKGGSHLCAPNFCSRYRSGARQPADPSLGMSHIGFRTVGAPP